MELHSILINIRVLSNIVLLIVSTGLLIQLWIRLRIELKEKREEREKEQSKKDKLFNNHPEIDEDSYNEGLLVMKISEDLEQSIWMKEGDELNDTQTVIDTMIEEEEW